MTPHPKQRCCKMVKHFKSRCAVNCTIMVSTKRWDSLLRNSNAKTVASVVPPYTSRRLLYRFVEPDLHSGEIGCRNMLYRSASLSTRPEVKEQHTSKTSTCANLLDKKPQRQTVRRLESWKCYDASLRRATVRRDNKEMMRQLFVICKTACSLSIMVEFRQDLQPLALIFFNSSRVLQCLRNVYFFLCRNSVLEFQAQKLVVGRKKYTRWESNPRTRRTGT